jgi:hypothetical protein
MNRSQATGPDIESETWSTGFAEILIRTCKPRLRPVISSMISAVPPKLDEGHETGRAGTRGSAVLTIPATQRSSRLVT